MKLPPISQSKRYLGLYVFEIDDRVCAGYTAGEVAMLLENESTRHGRAYRICRIDDRGNVELRGVVAEGLKGEDVIIFACRDAADAQCAFSDLRRLASEQAPPAPIELQLVDVPDLDAPHAVVLRFARHATEAVGTWLSGTGFNGGDMVMGGGEIAIRLQALSPRPVARAQLGGAAGLADRTWDEIVAAFDQPLQR